MSIQFNKATWYSKLLAIILYVGIFCWGFNLGSQYKLDIGKYSTHEITRTTDAGGNVVLGVGEIGVYQDIKIVFNAITQDNRCPKKVLCTLAGSVLARVTLVSGVDSKIVEIGLGGESYNFGDYSISIVKVLPEAVTTTNFSDDSYHITFHIESLKKL